MGDIFSKKKRSCIMSRIRGKDTKIEKKVQETLSNMKIKFEKHYRVNGNPDFALPRKKIAIFVDGDFWHGYNFKKRENKLPDYWVNKIKRNMKRDRKNNKELKKLGWKVLRVWEHSIMKSPDSFERKLKALLNRK